MDEADNETHGFLAAPDKWPCNDTAWLDAHIDRVARLFERDKNHTSVIMWSLGNEASYGENIAAMSEYLRKHDDKMGYHRLIHYEPAGRNRYGDAEEMDPGTVDVVSRMYPKPSDLMKYVEKTGDTRPVFWCEYCHSMGNGPGDLGDYWEVFYKTPQFIGGCIWEWADHVAPISEGKFGYGGDFGEETHDGNFCCDGLVFAERSFKTGSLEAKAVYQPLSTEWSNGTLTLQNRYDFTNLSETTLRYTYEVDGTVVKEGTLSLDVNPHETVHVPLDIEAVHCLWGAYLNIYMDQDGKTVATTQHLIAKGSYQQKAVDSAEITCDPRYATVKGDGFAYLFDLHYGVLCDLNGYLKTPMHLTIWRAPTDNEMFLKRIWGDLHYNKMHNKVYDVAVEDHVITVKAALSPISKPPIVTYTTTYTFLADGRIDVTLNGTLSNAKEFLPRLGFEFQTDAKEFTYFGYGPCEAYIDMHNAAKMGLYQSSAGKEYVDYIKPQEHGNHFNTKLLQLGDYSFVANDSFEFCVSAYETSELENKKHNFELEKSAFTNVRIDYKGSGIGSNSCGPALQEKYRMKDAAFTFTFSICKTENLHKA